MARQVAHEIKNPLTPIQLSAEHLRRVHADRGEPLGPVLESCVTSILGQVRLLRQISAEFSSFASSPTAKPRAGRCRRSSSPKSSIPTATGLAGRIEIVNRVAAPLPPVLRRSHARRPRAREHRRERAARDAGRGDADARCARRRAAFVTLDGAGHRRRHGRGGAGPRLRAVLLHQDHRHRPRPADRAAQHRAERRHDRGRERRRARERR